MATYGANLYGSTTYGTVPALSLSVSPFTARPLGYNTLHISWTPPSSTQWLEMRLVKGRAGFPVSQDDGTVLVDTTTSLNQFFDTGLSDNTWYYYAVWFNTPAVGWTLGGVASGLSVADSNMTTLLWNRLPAYYRSVPPNSTNFTVDIASAEIFGPNGVENADLYKFISVLGWGLDYLKAYHETIEWALSPSQVHVENLQLLAQTFGIEYETGVPAKVMRNKIRNAGLLTQARGTLRGISEIISDTIGWRVETSLSGNLMLNEDSSDFVNPSGVPVLNSAYEYIPFPIGTTLMVVNSNNNEYYQSTSSTVGLTPSGNNQWRTLLYEATPYNSPNYSYANFSYLPTVTNPPLTSLGLWGTNNGAGISLFISSGGTAPSTVSLPSPQPHPTNVMGISAGNQNIWSIPDGTGTTPKNVVDYSVPIPIVLAYDPDQEYETGQFVEWEGVSWRALGRTMGHYPSLFPELWAQVGIDDRLPVQAMMELFDFRDPIYPNTDYISELVVQTIFFDAWGNMLPSLYADDSSDNTMFYDTFGSGGSGSRIVSSDSLNRGAVSWNTSSATSGWNRVTSSDGRGVIAAPSGGGFLQTTTSASSSNAVQGVGVTFRKLPLSTAQNQYLIVTVLGSGTSVVVSRTGIGTLSTSNTYTQAVAFAEAIPDDTHVSAGLTTSTGNLVVSWPESPLTYTTTQSAWIVSGGVLVKPGIAVI